MYTSIPPGYVLPLYHPGYTMYIPPSTVVPLRLHRDGRVYSNEALGSNLGILTEREVSKPLRTLRVLALLCPSAQSYSGSPVDNIGKIG